MRLMLRIGAVAALAFGVSLGLAQAGPAVEQGDYVAHDFHFRSGESLQVMKLHYRTLGAPHRDAQGHVDNAVLILPSHGALDRDYFHTGVIMFKFHASCYGTHAPIESALASAKAADG